MLGYVKCDAGELLVRQHGLYRALYCGLCRSARKNLGLATAPFHSYDFVFLAAARHLFLKEPYVIEKERCFLHPFRRRAVVADNPVLRDAAFAQLLMIREKMLDDLCDRDGSFFRRLVCRLYLPFLRREEKKALRRDPSLQELSDFAHAAFARERQREKDGGDLDDMCSGFGAILSRFAAFRAQGNEAILLGGLGDKLGRFLYTLDALDDLEKDAKAGAFNPVLNRYGDSEETKKHLTELDAVQGFYLHEMFLALSLVDGDPDLSAICENVVCRGLAKEEKKVLEKRKGEIA